MRIFRGFLGIALFMFTSACVVDLPERSLDGASSKRDGPVVDAPLIDPNCGNSTLDVGELCDTAIATGQAGACPTSCDDGLSCTSDELEGAGTCRARCSFTAISVCADGDGCCPAGCDATKDKDCSKDCGNGKLDDLETCDTGIAAGQAGACPTSCDDQISCTNDTLLNGGGCAAQCSFTAITVCQAGDGCCPTGCNSQNDADCSAKCGDGILDKDEKCDIKIAEGNAGACPKDCDDGLACTKDTLLNVGTCNAQCQNSAVLQCKDGDNCCPTGCTNNNDKDCTVTCGNKAVEPGETCDKAIAAGQAGACPSNCDDGQACTINTLLNPGTCTAECSTSAVQQCKNGDGCCPTGCNGNNDDDCGTHCHNGVVEPGETCDTAISSGAGKCPTSCNDGKACTKDKLLNAGTCTASCTHSNISSCTGGDGCCPSGCNNNNDSDCPVVCGNGAVEGNEKCDGNCPSSCPGQTCKSGSVVGSGCQRECSYTNVPNGAGCSGGTCVNGSCCGGCRSGSSCLPGTSTGACGDNGANCQSCQGSACKNPVCTSSGSCSTSNKPNGTSCSGGSCVGGDCCTGCVQGSSCRAGNVPSACGDNGGPCKTCSTTNECKTAACNSSGNCVLNNRANGTACTNGKCYNGSCCTGCWNGSSCQPGTSNLVCGDGGNSCGTCTGGSCSTASCSTGSCLYTPKVGNCPGGKCYNGSCCTGCWNGSSCQPGWSTHACGEMGVTCISCSGGCCDAGRCFPVCP